MLADNMDVIEVSSSDNDDDFDFDFDDPIDDADQQSVSSNATFGWNGSEQPIRFHDQDWLKNTPASSSSQPSENRSATGWSSEANSFHGPMNNGFNMHDSNGQHRILPPSLTNGRHIESIQNKAPAGLADRIYRHSSSSMGMPRDSASAIPTAHKIDNVGKKLNDFAMDVNNDNKRSLPPSLTNGNAAKTTHSNVASGARQFPLSPFTNGNSRSSGENRSKGEFVVNSNHVGTNVVNGIGMTSSSLAMTQKPFVNSGQKMVTENNDDDIYIYGGSSSYRVLPPSLASRNSASNVEVVSGVDGQSRPILEDRPMDCDERVIYQEALQHLGQQKSEEADLPEGILSVSLLKHQKLALAWMVSKENSSHCAGGILADDQGLGKTVSMIALIQKQMEQQSKFTSVDSNRLKAEALNLDEDDEAVTVVNKTEQIMKDEPKKELGASTSSSASILAGPAAGTSVVCPGSDVKQCAGDAVTNVDKMVQTVKVELKKETRASTSSSASASSATRPAAGTLVVCPASVLKQWANELTDKVAESAKLNVLVYHGGARTRNPSELAKYDVVVTTYTIVTNEVPKQNLAADDDAEQKNSEKYGISPEFSANNKRKPPSNAQNKAKKKKKKLKDSDIDYDSGPLARVRWFRVVLDEAQTIKNHRTQVARACCGLRAKRRWCLSGTPIQNTIDDLYSYFRFLKYDPLSVYSSFCSMIKHPISRNASHGYKKLQAVLRIVLLRRTKETLIDGEPIIQLPPKTICLSKVDFTPEERAFYLTLEERSRQQFKAYAAAGTLKQNYANILLLLLRLRQACDHPLLVKGYQSDSVGNGSIEMARQLPRGMVINLLGKLEGGSAICDMCNDPPEDAVVAMCGHVFCYQCIHERLTSDENTCPAPNCRNAINAESVFSQGALKICISDRSDSNATTSSSTADEELSLISQSSYISSKIRAAVDILDSMINTNALTESASTIGSSPCQEAPVKAIVFSQWTSMLDLLELSLNSNLIQYRRLDGTMSLVSRDRAVKDFNTDPEVRVMLMSLKAGNLGLNMVAACHVILLDLWWNPYAEDQAIDRAHRIGQTRPVTVSRITIQDTVEDRILALQEEKRTMVNSAFGEDKSSGHATRLTVEDLRYLFRV